MNLIATPHKKTSADISDQKKLARMAVKIYLLGSLAWDYADTVCNIAASMRLSQTKKVSRAIRELKHDYDRFRSRSLSNADVDKETELGLLFESLCQNHFNKLVYGLSVDAVPDLNEDYKMLIKAVYMALTIIDTMILFAKECDDWIQSQGVNAHSILADHFHRLSSLLPLFAGDCYGKSDSRELTSRILLKEIKRIEIYDDNGRV